METLFLNMPKQWVRVEGLAMENHLVYGQMQVGQTELCVKSGSNGK